MSCCQGCSHDHTAPAEAHKQTYTERVQAWAKSQGYEAWLADHAAVMRNLVAWLDKE